MNPRVEVNIHKVKHNTEHLVKLCAKNNVSVMGVTKVFCGNKEIAKAMVHSGVKYLADSRIENLIGLSDIKVPKVLLRIPMQSEIEQVVKYADYSLNSEVSTIARISREAAKHHGKHKIILMVDLGDLREGVWYEEAPSMIKELMKYDGIEIMGIGTNLTCYGGVIPSYANLSVLANIAETVRSSYGINLPIVSGGNSSSLHLLQNESMPVGINNLRIGEAIALGRETAFGRKIDNLYDDAFTLHGEIIEIKNKPSVPLGSIGVDAFGNKPVFENRGVRSRAIIALGRQDIDHEGLTPSDTGIEVIGSSSDHLIIDITDSEGDYSIGSEISFKMSYGCLLQSMTSKYVKKVIIKEDARRIKRLTKEIA